MSDKPKMPPGCVTPIDFKVAPMPFVHDCEHGTPGGCEVTCRNCGHTCRRHMSGGGRCDHEGQVRDVCGCDEYEGSEG